MRWKEKGRSVGAHLSQLYSLVGPVPSLEGETKWGVGKSEKGRLLERLRACWGPAAGE